MSTTIHSRTDACSDSRINQLIESDDSTVIEQTEKQKLYTNYVLSYWDLWHLPEAMRLKKSAKQRRCEHCKVTKSRHWREGPTGTHKMHTHELSLIMDV